MLIGFLFTAAWCVFTWLLKYNLQIRGMAVNILNKYSRAAEKGWSSILEVERGANDPSP
jgi:hypothetical protein